MGSINRDSFTMYRIIFLFAYSAVTGYGVDQKNVKSDFGASCTATQNVTLWPEQWLKSTLLS